MSVQYNNLVATPFNDWQEIDIIVSRDCTLRCSYCLPAGTLITTPTYDQVPIETLCEGDEVLGFNEYPSAPFLHHKVDVAKVVGTVKRTAPVIRIKTEGGREILITPNHPIMNSRGQSRFAWKEAGKYRVGDRIKVAPKVDFLRPDPESEDYKIGYFLGIMLGDGPFRFYPKKAGGFQYKIRVAMNDSEAIDRMQPVSAALGVALYKKRFDLGINRVQALFANALAVYTKIVELVSDNFGLNQTLPYYQGFLAGIYDAEGSIDSRGTIRISDNDQGIIDEIGKGLNALNMKFAVERKKMIHGQNKPVMTVRILYPRKTIEYLKFIKSVFPAISRKSTQNILGKSILVSDKIASIEKAGLMEVYNLETTSKTYIANGICVHNCYLHKSREKSYDMEAIITSLEHLLGSCTQEGVVIGLFPEPWVNPERTNELLKRIAKTLLKHPKYATNFMIMLGTNGVNLHKKIPMVEHLKTHLSLNVTLDGVKEQHDLYRVFEDGSGSWDIVMANIQKHQDEYNIRGTKVTLGPETLKYAFESTMFLWDGMKMTDVNMNVVFEDLWGDRKAELLQIFEGQLSKLYDEILKNKRWSSNFTGLLATRNIPVSQLEKGPVATNRTYCGAAQMRSIDADGAVYPCFRLSPHSLSDDKTFSIGEHEGMRALRLIDNFDTVTELCRGCPLLSSCAMCVGGAFEEKKSLFWRTTHHCEFVKLQYKYSRLLYNALNPGAEIPDLLEGKA